MRPFFSTSPELRGPETPLDRAGPSMRSGFSRREFLRAIPVSLLAVACSRRRYDPSRFHVADRSTVALLRSALRTTWISAT